MDETTAFTALAGAFAFILAMLQLYQRRIDKSADNHELLNESIFKEKQKNLSLQLEIEQLKDKLERLQNKYMRDMRRAKQIVNKYKKIAYKNRKSTERMITLYKRDIKNLD